MPIGSAQLIFHPPLKSIIPVNVDPPSAHIMGPRLRWKATLGWEDYDTLRHAQGEVQVWSKCTGGQWAATPFKKRTTVNASDKDLECVDLSLFEPSAETDDTTQVSLEASIPLPPLVGPTVSVDFTYRVQYATNGRINWMGTSASDGKFVLGMQSLNAENWIDGGNGAFQWTCKPMVITKLSSDAKWSGWALKGESTGSMVIHRFTGVATDSFAGPVAALALQPQPNTDACVVYSPVLYTAQNAALSLEDGDVLLHRGDGESSLNAYNSTSTWKDHIPHGPAPLDLQTPDVLGVSVKSQTNVGHLHFLPVIGTQSIITLTLSDIASVVASSSVVLFDSNLHAIKFLPGHSSTERLRIAVGPVGGEIIVVPAYILSASISVAFLLHDPGSTAELEANAGIPSPKGHPPQELFSLAVCMFRHVWDLLLSTISPRSPLAKASASQSVTRAPQDTTASPRVAFKVTGKSSLLVKSEDVSKLLILVGGKPLQATPKHIGGEHWLIESTSELETDYHQRRIEILLRE